MSETLREALVWLRSYAHHAGYCAAGEQGGSVHCICGLTTALIRTDRALATPPVPGGTSIDAAHLARQRAFSERMFGPGRADRRVDDLPGAPVSGALDVWSDDLLTRERAEHAALRDGPWQQLSDAATPGPWAATTTPGFVTGHLTAGGRNIADMRYRNGHADAALIVAAVNYIRAALDEVKG